MPSCSDSCVRRWLRRQERGRSRSLAPPAPFEALQDEDGWWADNERTHMQRLQEQEKQRATQLRHTRAWAESQVRSPRAGLPIGSPQQHTRAWAESQVRSPWAGLPIGSPQHACLHH